MWAKKYKVGPDVKHSYVQPTLTGLQILILLILHVSVQGRTISCIRTLSRKK